MSLHRPGLSIKICSVPALLLLASTGALAYSPNDTASLQMHLQSDWQITDTRENLHVVKVIEYTRNGTGDHKQILLQTIVEKPPTDKAGSSYVKELYLSTQQKLAEKGCHYDSITHIPQTAGSHLEWGLYWECEHNQRTGFQFFIDGDAKTLFTLTYKAEHTYPLSDTDRKTMQTLLRSIALCYENKTCTPLVR